LIQISKCITTTLYGLDIYLYDVLDIGYTFGDLNQYDLYVNNIYVGTADCIFEFHAGKVMRFIFDTSVSVVNEGIVYELTTTHDSQLKFAPFVYVSQDWENKDYSVIHRFLYYHNNPSTMIDGSPNGNAVHKGICYKVYHSVYTTPDDIVYDNSIQIADGFEPEHPTEGVPYMNLSDGIDYGYFIVSVNNTESPFYKLKIFKDGVELFEQGYPITIVKDRAVYGYTPLLSGSYSINLTTSADVNIVGKDFYVIGDLVNNDFNLWCVKEPSCYQCDYKIYYDINLAGTYYIGIFNEEVNDRYVNNAGILFECSSTDGVYNVEGFRAADVSPYLNIIRFFKYTNQNGTDVYEPVGSIFVHRISSIGISSINVYGNEDRERYDTHDQLLVIEALHPFVVGEIAIFLNDDMIMEHVSNVMIGYYETNFYGIHNFSLRGFIDDDWETLDYHVIMVTEKPEQVPQEDILPVLEQPIASIIGMIITLFCLMMPFMFARGLGIKQSIHPVIYGFSGSMGIAVCVILGLFPTWIPFFLVATGIIIIVVVYLYKHTGGE
jgi:hypothetical protein